MIAFFGNMKIAIDRKPLRRSHDHKDDTVK